MAKITGKVSAAADVFSLVQGKEDSLDATENKLNQASREVDNTGIKTIDRLDGSIFHNGEWKNDKPAIPNGAIEKIMFKPWVG